MLFRAFATCCAFLAIACGGTQTKSAAPEEDNMSSSSSSDSTSLKEGEALINQGDFEKAKDFFADVIKEHPENAGAHYYLGLAEKNLGNAEAAEEEYRLAIGYDANLPAAHNNLGLLLLEKGDLTHAESELHTYLSMEQKNAEAHYNYALVQEAQGNLANAKEHYQKAGDLDPEDPSPWLGLGDLARRENDFDEALADYKKGRAVDSQMPELALREGQTLLDLKRLDEAAEVLGSLADLKECEPEILTTAGILLAKFDEDERALALYRAALKHDDNYAKAHFLLANALARGKKFAEAVKHYERFISIAKDSAEVATARERLKMCRSQMK
jgi:tetratricopeptide (TPR) repeat protein